MLTIYLKGMWFCLALIAAIGLQNTHILKMGIKKNHVFICCLICIIGDVILFASGILLIPNLTINFDIIIKILVIVGALFLGYYSYDAFYSAFKKNETLNIDNLSDKISLKKAVLTTLAVTFLNPHAMIDTQIVASSIATSIDSQHRILFYLGTISGSFIWFTSLGIGAKLLSPLFKKPITWKILDFLIGIIMLFLCISLIIFFLQYFKYI